MASIDTLFATVCSPFGLVSMTNIPSSAISSRFVASIYLWRHQTVTGPDIVNPGRGSKTIYGVNRDDTIYVTDNSVVAGEVPAIVKFLADWKNAEDDNASVTSATGFAIGSKFGSSRSSAMSDAKSSQPST